MRSRFPAWSLGGLILMATPAVAQQPVPTPAATVPPEASALPPPISVAPVVVSTPTVTLPVATPTPRATPRPRVTPSPTPPPRASETPRVAATPTPRATPTPSPVATPEAVATPTPVATVPVAVPTAPPVPPAAEEPGSSGWLFPGAVVLVLAVVAGVLLARRRRRAEDVLEEEPVEVVHEVAPTLPVEAVTAPRAWLAFELTPRRAGVNLLTATLDAHLVVRNEGEAAATDVRAEVRLTSAREGQEGELAALFADTGGRPVAAPFALGPGEERVLNVLATLPREAINVLTAGGRPMFVPVAAVNVRYASGEMQGQTAAAFAVGVERDGAAKLMPFWLDGPGRMFDAVAARPHALAVRS